MRILFKELAFHRYEKLGYWCIRSAEVRHSNIFRVQYNLVQTCLRKQPECSVKSGAPSKRIWCIFHKFGYHDSDNRGGNENN